MTDKLFIPVILGTNRDGRNSLFVAQFISQELQKLGVESEIIDVKDYKVAYDGAKAEPSDYADKISKSNGIVIVFPEYNHSFPGSLKTLLDSEFNIYKGKVVATASVSAGNFGGARGTESIIPVLTNFGMILSGIQMHFPFVEKNFPKTAQTSDQDTIKRVSENLNSLISLCQKLK
jgi:NAD(P)H-dependent FMN reductase